MVGVAPRSAKGCRRDPSACGGPRTVSLMARCPADASMLGPQLPNGDDDSV